LRCPYKKLDVTRSAKALRCSGLRRPLRLR
jgi:hypothetical protein